MLMLVDWQPSVHGGFTGPVTPQPSPPVISLEIQEPQHKDAISVLFCYFSVISWCRRKLGKMMGFFWQYSGLIGNILLDVVQVADGSNAIYFKHILLYLYCFEVL